MRKFLTALFVLASVVCAQAQTKNLILQLSPGTGAAMPSGFNFAASPPLFASPSASLNSLSGAFGISMWMQVNSNIFPSPMYYFNNQGPNPITSSYNQGFAFTYTNTQAPGFEYFTAVSPGIKTAGYAGGCGRSSTTCLRDILLTGGGWHHVCQVWDPNAGMTVFVDGIQWDQNVQTAGGYAPSTAFWTVGPTVGLQPIAFRDIRVYWPNKKLDQQSCSKLYVMGAVNNQIPNSGDLNTGMIAHWTLSAASCTPSGPSTVCTDSSGNNNTLTTDQTPPVPVIIGPTVGNYTGNIAFSGTCTDAISCASVHWLVDGSDVSGAVTASPFSFTWDSTHVTDGPHVVTMQASNVSNTIGTATVNITTTNGLATQAYYFDPVAGSDSNNCKTTATPCKTLEKASCGLVYHGGDSINLKQGTTFTLVSGLSCGTPGNKFGFTIAGSSVTGLIPQNYFPGGGGAPLTITTYGGGTCNVFGSISGCATIALDPASPVNNPVILADWQFATLQNVLVTGGTPATISPAGVGGAGILIRQSLTSNLAGGVVTNVKVSDFTTGISSIDFTNFTSGCTVSNSIVTAASATSDAQVGIYVQGDGNNCHIIGNYVSNMGCTSGNLSECKQGGILISNHASDNIDEFNVTTAIAANNRNCGGPYGNWIFDVKRVTLQFNESFNNGPLGAGAGAGCDMGDYDIDGSVQDSILQYNYAHDTYGNAFVLFSINLASQGWDRNTSRYNIAEHTFLACGDGSGGVHTLGGATFSSANIYNNTIWNNAAGETSPFNGCSPIRQAAFSDSSCPSNASYIANNIFAATPSAGFVRFFGNFSNIDCHATLIYRNNDWFAISGGVPLWSKANNGVSYTSYATWSAYSGETGGQTVDPKLVSPGNHPTCYAGGVPTGPQPCDAGMKLQAGSPMLGAGINLNSAFGIDIGTRDYFGNACPGSMGGTGINIGADACGNP